MDGKYLGLYSHFTCIRLGEDVSDQANEVVVEGSQAGHSIQRQGDGKPQGQFVDGALQQ